MNYRNLNILLRSRLNIGLRRKSRLNILLILLISLERMVVVRLVIMMLIESMIVGESLIVEDVA